jgi:hypothetical protein
MLYPKTTVSVLIITLFCAAAGLSAQDEPIMPGMPGMYDMQPEPGQRGQRETSRDARDAERLIEDALEMILRMVQENADVPAGTIDKLQNALKQGASKRKQFSDQGQSSYYLLYAWTTYLQGDIEKASQISAKAYRTAPGSQDAHISYITLSILAGEQIRQLPERMTKNLSRKRGELEFDLESLNNELMGTEFPTGKMNCINNAVYEYQGNENICAMLWQLEEKTSHRTDDDQENNTPADPCEIAARKRKQRQSRNRQPNQMQPPMGGPMPGMPGMPGQGYDMPDRPQGPKVTESLSEQMQAFADWYIDRYNSKDIKFLAVNTDQKSAKEKVVQTLCANPWPWAQIMAAEQNNMQKFNEMNIKGALCLFTDDNGTIIYAGPSTGFVPKMILNSIAQIKSSKPKPARTTQTAQNRQRQTSQQRRRQNADSRKERQTPAGTGLDQEAKMAPEEEYRAQKLIETAKGFMKSGYTMGQFTGYRRGIDMCREVLEKWPNSKYADQARDLLNQIPERYHKRYKITPEELGR